MKIIQALLTVLLLSTPAWANVPNATPLFNQYTCNSSTTQFPYSFQITASSDMTAYLTDTSGNTTQLSSGVFSVDTTNLWVNYPLMGSPCATNYVLTLRPSTPQTQTTTYGARTPFTATAVGASFDKLTLISQQLQGQINRTFLQPANVTTQVTFPGSSPGSLIGWNGSGVLTNVSNPSAVAQWTLSGANISYNTGNVSTTNTFTAGTLTDGTATLTGGVLTGSVTGNLTGTVQTAAQPNVTSLGTLTSLLTSGNVGIGTATVPAERLGVFGGNVGVGTSTPGQALDVVGTIRATGWDFSNQPYIKVTNTQTQNTAGGATTSGSWLALILNTKDADTASIASLCTGNATPVATCTAANQIVLPAGTYKISAYVPIGSSSTVSGSSSQVRLFNVTGSAVLINGRSTYAYAGDPTDIITGQFTLASTVAVDIQYQTQNSQATNGQGVPANFGVEVYATVEITKIK